jgi:hypothetical protein
MVRTKQSSRALTAISSATACFSESLCGAVDIFMQSFNFVYRESIDVFVVYDELIYQLVR